MRISGRRLKWPAQPQVVEAVFRTWRDVGLERDVSERGAIDRTYRIQCVGHDFPVARHADVVVGKIGEQRVLAEFLPLTRMARGAVALGRIVEQRKAARFSGGKRSRARK